MRRPHTWRVPTHQRCGVMEGGTDLGEGPILRVWSLVQVEYLNGRSECLREQVYSPPSQTEPTWTFPEAAWKGEQCAGNS